MDCIFQAQASYSQSQNGWPTELGLSHIGFGDMKIHCFSSDINSSIVYLLGFCDNLIQFETYMKFALPGTVAIDVGANLGIHSLVLAKCVGEKGNVIAFEPVPSLRRRLIENLNLNGVWNVHAKEFAVGDGAGAVRFSFEENDFNIGKAHVSKAGDRIVNMTTLDAELIHIDRHLSLIKIDVEGYELSVLTGAVKTIKRHRPAIVMEFNPGSYSLDELKQTLPIDYSYYRMPVSYYNEFQSIQGTIDKNCDLLLVPKEKLSVCPFHQP